MSAIIARAVGDEGFRGREHRRNGYPSLLGKTLWRLYHQPFKRDLSALLEFLLDQHTGWNNLVESEWAPGQPTPCLCHNALPTPEYPLTENTPGRHQWCYRFARTSMNKAYMDILFKAAPQARWHSLGRRILLDAPEPNWFTFEALAGYIEAELSGCHIDLPDMIEDVDRQALLLEAAAQQHGALAAIAFRLRSGAEVLVRPDRNTGMWLLSTQTAWGLADMIVTSRPEGILLALRADKPS